MKTHAGWGAFENRQLANGTLKPLHNSRMKLTATLAAQRILRPRCLRRLPAAYASVIGAEKGSF
jgi:hypothetical protein